MRRKPMKEVPVLIAGGGPVGMTLAKTLASFGIECMLVEKNPSTTRHPKMDITNSRSMELFRKLGLSKHLRDVAVPETNNFDVSWITSLSGHELHRFRYPSVEQARAIIRERNDGSQPVEPAMRVSQVAIEPVLKRAIEAEPKVDVRFGVAFEDLVQDLASVIATVRNVETGETEKIKCQYLVGCDGGVSQVRACLDIRYDGTARVAQLYMVHFRSDARDVLQPWGVAWHYQTSQATMIAQNDRDIWTLHTFLPPDVRLGEIDPSICACSAFRGASVRIRDPGCESLESAFARCRKLSSWTCLPRGRLGPPIHSHGWLRAEYGYRRCVRRRLEAGRDLERLRGAGSSGVLRSGTSPRRAAQLSGGLAPHGRTIGDRESLRGPRQFRRLPE